MNNEPILIVALIGALVCLFLFNLYVYKNCSVKVTAKIIGLSEFGKNPYSSQHHMMILEYTYNNLQYKKPTYVNIKDMQLGSIVEVYINPKKPTMMYHKSGDKALIKLALVLCAFLVISIIMMIKK